MPQADLWVIGAQLVLLSCAFVGAGEGYLRLAFRILRTNPKLGWVERAVVNVYVPLGILYVVASVPLPLFFLATVVGVLLVGWALVIFGEARKGDFANRVRKLVSPLAPGGRLWTSALILGLSTLGLLAFEVVVMGGVAAPNTFDGSIQVDFVVLLLRNHSVPWTLAPFAPDAGVVYPQGTAVSLAAATIMFGWPVVMSPAFLSPFFAALAVPAAYAFGTRIYATRPRSARQFGLLLAVVFALLATWPRFLVGGSYDFLFAFPLLLLLGGGATSLSRDPRKSWSSVLLFAAGVGILAALSLVATEFLLTFLFLLVLVRQRSSLTNIGSGMARTFMAGTVALLFLGRGIAGYLVWWSYPQHVRTEVGSGTVAISSGTPSNPLGTFIGLADPFLFRPIDVWLSPFPILKGELAFLLVLGVYILVWSILHNRSTSDWPVLPESSETLLVGIGAGLFLIALFVAAPGALPASLPTNDVELATCLFTFYVVIATIPLFWAWREVSIRLPRSPLSKQLLQTRGFHQRPHVGKRPSRVCWSLLAACLLLVPLASGLVITVVQAPIYLGAITGPLGNVSEGDYSALVWMGSHLPACSGILVAPGSAGLFLPAYSTARVIYPMVPAPANLSYHRAVRDLSSGFLNASTLSDLRALQITEVFVTGQTNLLWPPFQAIPLLTSPSFTLLYQNGDALVFEFTPETQSLDCSPPT